MREMKESGVQWIGKIPEHWETVALQRVVSLINEKSMKQGIPYIGLENIESYTGKLLPLGGTEPEGICNQFKKGDVLFSKLRPYLTKCVSPSFDGKCTSELLVLRNFKGIVDYLKYVLLSPKLIMEINSSTYGTKMPRASWNYIKQCSIPLPPLPEQQRIATFLDQKCKEIDDLIALQEEMITELQAYKQSVISETVTKGLNPKVELKDSGVQWIGKIPEHWEVCRLKNYFKIGSGTTPQSDNPLYWGTEYNWITPADFKTEDIYIEYGKRSLSELGYKSFNLTLYPAQSIIFSKRAPIGQVVINN